MYAFVTFMEVEAARKCVEQKKVPYGDRFLRVKPFTPKTVNGGANDSGDLQFEGGKTENKFGQKIMCQKMFRKKKNNVFSDDQKLSEEKGDEKSEYVERQKAQRADKNEQEEEKHKKAILRAPGRKKTRQRPKEPMVLQAEVSAFKLAIAVKVNKGHNQGNLRYNFIQQTKQTKQINKFTTNKFSQNSSSRFRFGLRNLNMASSHFSPLSYSGYNNLPIVPQFRSLQAPNHCSYQQKSGFEMNSYNFCQFPKFSTQGQMSINKNRKTIGGF